MSAGSEPYLLRTVAGRRRLLGRQVIMFGCHSLDAVDVTAQLLKNKSNVLRENTGSHRKHDLHLIM